jgi:hypothetical protein
LGRVPDRIVPGNFSPAAGWRQDRGEHAHSGGLAGPVLTQQRQHFTRLDIEAHTIDRFEGIKILTEVFTFDHEADFLKVA